MKKLEEKIIRKVYKIETKSTFIKLLTTTIIVLGSISVGAFLAVSVYSQLVEQQTFDLLDIFQEDISVIKQYIADVLYTFYLETPKLTLLLSLGGLAIGLIGVTISLRNFGRIKNKVLSIRKYWERHY